MKILLTGIAGFIGYHFARKLGLEGQHEVVGVDSLNDYYDPALKTARLSDLGLGPLAVNRPFPNLSFHQMEVEDTPAMEALFETHRFEAVVHLAAQAGVRYSLTNPYPYIATNVLGFLNILESCRRHQTSHLIYASSSSVYGLNRHMPFQTSDPVDHPVSLYAATKRSNELMAHTYSHLYGLPTTGLRFFTVYGPFGRPDMAYFSFTQKVLEGKTIQVFNHGQMKRDFTYVDDIVAGMLPLLDRAPQAGKVLPSEILPPDVSPAPFALYNIGNHQPVALMDFIRIIEQTTGKTAQIEFLPMQPGDVEETYADVSGLEALVGFHPHTSLEEGLPKFIHWYRDYYGA